MLKLFLKLKLWVLALFSSIQVKPQAVDNPLAGKSEVTEEEKEIEKQAEMFTRSNSLRDEFFGKEAMVAYKGKMYRESELKQFPELQDEFDKGFMQCDPSPWNDHKRFPLKTREITAEELNMSREDAKEETIERGGELSTKLLNNNEYDD